MNETGYQVIRSLCQELSFTCQRKRTIRFVMMLEGYFWNVLRRVSLGILALMFGALLVLALLAPNAANAELQSQIFNTSGTFVVPDGVSVINVQAWGGGGAGGGSRNTGSWWLARGGAGGGGSAYASSNLGVSPGDTLTLTVAGQANGNSGADGDDGGDSYVEDEDNNVLLLAAGGKGGTGNTDGGEPAGGAGGAAGDSIGQTRVAGDNGGNGTTGFGVSSGAGGNGAQGGGAGGASVTRIGNTADGNPGNAPGGGGSGSRTSQNNGEKTGGAGAAGRVIITWDPTAVIIGAVALDCPAVSELLENIGATESDASGLLRLLRAWDPAAAEGLDGSDRAELMAALVDYLDPDGDGIVVVFRWETLQERGTVGFYAERFTGGTWVRINTKMLPGMIAAPMGAEYWLADPGVCPGDGYRYRLIEVEATGTTREYGPFDLQTAKET